MIGAVAVFLVAIGIGWIGGWFSISTSSRPTETETRIKNKPIDQAIARTQGLQTVKAGRLNLQLKIANRWSAQVLDTGLVDFSKKDYKPGLQEIILTDKENGVNAKIFKWYHPDAIDTDVMHRWMQDEGVRRLLVEYLVGKSYTEKDRTILQGNLGSGEEMTVVSLALDVDDETEYARIAYVIRGKWYTREFLVFFFHNEKSTHEISDDDLTMITGSASMMFDPM